MMEMKFKMVDYICVSYLVVAVTLGFTKYIKRLI